MEGQQHGAIKTCVAAVLGWLRRDFVWWLPIIPILSSYAVYWASSKNLYGWGDSGTFKPLMEIAHPTVIAGALVASLQGWRLTRDMSFALLCALSSCVLFREIVGQGSSVVLYLGILGLTVYAVKHQHALRRLFPSRWALSFLFMCFLCYTVSQLLDRGAIKRIGWLLLWDRSWKPPFSSNLEEALETLGGCFLLLTPLAIRRDNTHAESDTA